MKKFLKNYKSTIILIMSIIIGMIIGLIFKEKTYILKPLGDLFLNLLLIIIVPLIFVSLTVSIGRMKNPKRIGKILLSTILVFIFTSLIAAFVGLLVTRFELISIDNSNALIKELSNDNISTEENTNFLETFVSTISTDDFVNLLSKDNMIALIVFSIIVGFSINLSKEKGKPLLELLESLNEIIQKFIKIIMYYAPIGLGAYFAYLVGTFGNEIAIGYTKVFIIYTIISILYYFIIYSFYAFIAGGKKGFITYWKNIIPPTFTAIATCSSAASIPVNSSAAKNIGVSEDVADTVIPLGTSFHKDGSVIGSVFKIMFLVYLFNSNIGFGKVILIALVATVLVTAVPIGGGTISEMFIITSLGFPIGALPMLTVIATIIDPPATMLNVTGDTACCMLVSRIVDKKKSI